MAAPRSTSRSPSVTLGAAAFIERDAWINELLVVIRRFQPLRESGLIAARLLVGMAVIPCLWLVAQAEDGNQRSSVQAESRKSEFQRPARVANNDAGHKVELGRTLFFDPVLSRSQLHSCASCHQPDKSWADGLARARGEGGQPMYVRAPTLLNIAEVPILGWDGKFRNLEAVAFSAISNPMIMNLTEGEVLGRLAARPDYVAAFAQVYRGEGITRRTVEGALAAFQRTIVSGPAPFDRWIEGDDAAVSDEAKRGFRLFTGKAQCAACHRGWSFTDGSFHDIGVAVGGDIGRGRLFPNSPKLTYAFKTPTLRDAARRAPYMHDGSVATLEAVIDLYDKGGIDRPSRSTLIRPLGLTSQDKADLITFLQTLDEDPRRATASASLDRGLGEN